MSQEVKLLILNHFYQINRAMRQRVEVSEGVEDLTMHQLQALFFVQHEQPVRMGDVAAELRISPGSASLLADRLVESKWLLRSSDPQDRRSVFLELTEGAGKKLALLRDAKMQRAGKMLDILSESDLLELERILSLLNDSFQQESLATH